MFSHEIVLDAAHTYSSSHHKYHNEMPNGPNPSFTSKEKRRRKETEKKDLQYDNKF